MRALWVVLAAVGCYSPSYRDCAISCATSGCPDGLVCENGACRTAAGLPPCPTGSGDGGMSGDSDIRGDAALRLCPSSYNIAIGTSRYRFEESSYAKWQDAAPACAADLQPGPSPYYTHLVVIGDDNERKALLSHRTVISADYWIGLTSRKQNGVWWWVTVENTNGYPGAMGTPWGANQPTSDTSGANCVELMTGNLEGASNDGLFRNDYCTPTAMVMGPYICECDVYPDDPTRY
jgi:hypothetical protein